MMETRVCVLSADADIYNKNIGLSPNKIYKNPRITIQNKIKDEVNQDHIRLKMLYAGLCGTDMHLLQTDKDSGFILNSAPLTIPKEGRIIGHEGVGEVIAVGNNIDYLNIGDIVTFESIISCKVCNVCKRGNFNQCKNAKLLGMEVDGIYGEIVDIPAIITYNINCFSSSSENLKASTCIEPASVAFVALENLKIHPGDSLLIFGAGPIGALTAMLAKEVFGASMIYVIEPIPFRCNFIKKWSDYVFEDINQFFKYRKDIDKVVETSGYLNNIEMILPKMKENSNIVLLARTGSPLKISSVDHMITNEISITGSRGHLGRAFDSIIKLQASGRIRLQDIITNVYFGIEEIYDVLENRQSEILNKNCKVIFSL